MARLYKSERTLRRARRLRREMSEEERILWMLLRDRRLNQFKFRKQVPLGDYVGDFVCFGAKLVVELDGSQHAGQVEFDAKRDAYLREAGFRVLRISTGDLFNERERALETIVATLNAQHRSRPFPRGKERKAGERGALQAGAKKVWFEGCSKRASRNRCSPVKA